MKFEEEVKRLSKLQKMMGVSLNPEMDVERLDIRAYAKYVLKEGSVSEKRELLVDLRSRIIYTSKRVKLV